MPTWETRVQSLVWEDSTCYGVTKPVHHNYWACTPEPGEPQQLSPRATTTEACDLGPVLHKREATRVRSPCTTNREKHMQQQRLSTAKNYINIFLKNLVWSVWSSKERGRFNSVSLQSQPSFSLSQARQGFPRDSLGQIPTPWGKWSSPTDLHHHVPVQGPLSKVQAFPLLLREFDSQILESQLCLKWKTHFHWGNSWRVLTFTQDVNRKEAVRIDSVEVMDRFE